MDDQSPFAKALADIAAAEADYRLQRALLQEFRKTVNKLLHKLAGADDLSVWADSNRVTVSCNLTQLDGFKAPRLLRTLEQFAGPEWEAGMSEYPGSLNRDYRFSQRVTPKTEVRYPEDFRITVKVAAYVRSDSPTCRKVLVGKKRTTHVEKQYRIECS